MDELTDLQKMYYPYAHPDEAMEERWCHTHKDWFVDDDGCRGCHEEHQDMNERLIQSGMGLLQQSMQKEHWWEQQDQDNDWIENQTKD